MRLSRELRHNYKDHHIWEFHVALRSITNSEERREYERVLVKRGSCMDDEGPPRCVVDNRLYANPNRPQDHCMKLVQPILDYLEQNRLKTPCKPVSTMCQLCDRCLHLAYYLHATGKAPRVKDLNEYLHMTNVIRLPDDEKPKEATPEEATPKEVIDLTQ